MNPLSQQLLGNCEMFAWNNIDVKTRFLEMVYYFAFMYYSITIGTPKFIFKMLYFSRYLVGVKF